MCAPGHDHDRLLVGVVQCGRTGRRRRALAGGFERVARARVRRPLVFVFPGAMHECPHFVGKLMCERVRSSYLDVLLLFFLGGIALSCSCGSCPPLPQAGRALEIATRWASPLRTHAREQARSPVGGGFVLFVSAAFFSGVLFCFQPVGRTVCVRE